MAIRETDVLCGHIRGIAAGNPAVTAFKGIPYAEAPTGNNRWRPPIPKKPWSGTFDAVRFGNICPQVIPQPGTFYHKEFFSYSIWRLTTKTVSNSILDSRRLKER